MTEVYLWICYYNMSMRILRQVAVNYTNQHYFEIRFNFFNDLSKLPWKIERLNPPPNWVEVAAPRAFT